MQIIDNSRIHPLPDDCSADSLPAKFTNPFDYVPHHLCDRAFAEVRRYVDSREDFRAEFSRGKMVGVLIVRRGARLGFVASFSGTLCGVCNHDYFVPPVFDFLAPDGYFRREEAKIVEVNREIAALESDDELNEHLKKISQEIDNLQNELKKKTAWTKAQKAERDNKRKAELSEDEREVMVRESQFQKAELHRLKLRVQEKTAKLDEERLRLLKPIDALKEKRRIMSETLQHWLFTNFSFFNAKGESRSLYDIFINGFRRTPPSGSGECCAPRLLQYAFSEGLEPVCMAEYWVGESPASEIRRDGFHYPACKGKCEPILSFMLQGLELETDLPVKTISNVEMLYEDEWIVAVNKPSGVLSVPGKDGSMALIDVLSERLGKTLFSVHRLDKGTSGVLIVAKSEDAQRRFHSMFAGREVEKEYVALLDGELESEQGVIELPLAADYEHRPCQKVDYAKGKKSETAYKRIGIENGQTRVAFYPKTGRTHQLRVHSAHRDGLNMPIVGDALYGKKGERLLLHARRVSFTHPFSGKAVTIVCPPEF